MDEYRSLYRKYRPQAPGEVLGQEHVVRALAGAVRENRLAHAFLFSGPRGTGKTSSARILAKMVNCERGPTPEPCGVCEQCRRIENGTHLDVWEIDAASHGGVDDARELRERAPTAPAQGREKVYIIDEAQRLSREAFDALLKLFEEPPPGVRFVLCTTEPQKMPPTIAGRCQRFEFRRIPTDVIAGHLQKVARAEGIQVDQPAAEAIARQAEGAARDALSLLEQAALLGGGKVGTDEVGRLIGRPDLDVHFALADAVAVGDAREVFGIIHRLVQDGHDLRHFATQSTNHFRNLLLALASPDDPAIVDVPPELHERLAGQAAKFSAAELNRILSLLLQAQTDLRWTTSPRLTVELALVRAALPETDPQPAALLARVERLERLAGLDAPAASSGSALGSAPVTRGVPSAKPRAASPERTGHTADGASGGATASPEEPHEADGAAGAATVSPGQSTEARSPNDADEGRRREPEPRGGPEASQEQAAHAPTAGAVDTEMLRRSWPQVLDTLKAKRKMRLFASSQLATVGSFDGSTLELVFPPGRDVGAAKVRELSGDLVEVLGELFGIAPAITCTVREGAAVDLTDDEPPPSPEAAEALLRAQFGAELVEED
ncbi:MAG TPA: DNA polymerase III subunit gamma/tau [Actinomycetota bacterium]|nr:DNA polymerase III subunit gamma/tau [Actinomycetota bacterium]